MNSAPPKTPADILDYTRTWDEWLASGEAIAMSSWTVAGDDAALELGSGSRAATADATSATCWLLGGTVGATYTVTNHIVTTSTPPREVEQSFSIFVTDVN